MCERARVRVCGRACDRINVCMCYTCVPYCLLVGSLYNTRRCHYDICDNIERTLDLHRPLSCPFVVALSAVFVKYWKAFLNACP